MYTWTIFSMGKIVFGLFVFVTKTNFKKSLNIYNSHILLKVCHLYHNSYHIIIRNLFHRAFGNPVQKKIEKNEIN